MTKLCRLAWLMMAFAVGISVAPREAAAQAANRGRLIVTVTDATGGILPTADVRIVGLENATKATPVPPAKTDTNGILAVPNLVLGRYSIEVEFSGFDKAIVKEVRVRAGENRQTVVLQLKTLSDEVTVGQDRQEAAADRGVTFGTALTREQIEALSDDPAELRQQLLDMAGPGATIAIDSFEGGQLPPKSQIRSIRVSRDQFAAENHNAGGIRIDIITQPGSGPLRGSVNTSFYNSALDGKNPLVGQRPPSKNQNFGGYVSGGLIKDKLSFSAELFGGKNSNTPVLTTQTAAGPTYQSAGILATNSNMQFYASADYALTRDQTLRFNANRYTTTGKNQGVGTFNAAERAFSTENTSTGLYMQQTGPLGRRLALNSRLSLSWSDSTSSSVLEAPTIIISQEGTTGGAQRKGGDHSISLSLSSDLDYVRGLHSVRIGVATEHYRYRTDSNSNYLGTYTFESLAAFEAGQPRSYTRRIGDPNVRYTNTQVGIYIQDDIRVRKNLTLSPGLRYELQSLVDDRLNFAPRFGATWAPFKSGKTTLRSSIGVFYDFLFTNTYQQTLQVDGFRQQEVNMFNPSYPDPGALPAAPPVNRYLLGDGQTFPRTLRASFGVAHTFNSRFSAGTVYADTRGTSLLVGHNLNAPVDGVRPDPAFANVIEAVPSGKSRQRSLNSNVSINLAGLTPPSPTGGRLFDWRRGLRAGLNHTIADFKNNTDGAFSVPATNDLDLEWGPGNGDVRHRYGFNFGSNAIRSLNANVNFNWNTAPPLTIRTGLDDNGDLIFNDRPEGVGRNSERTRGQFNSNASFGYQIPLGSRSITSGGGVSISSQGGGLVINQMGMQTVPRYRLTLNVNIQNLLNRPNYSGFSGVMTSRSFLQPVSIQGVRRVNFNVGLSF
jgi:hypothetical protein